MSERIPKGVLVAAAVSAPFLLVYLAYSRPGYFTSQTYLGGLLLLEFLLLAVWMFRQIFFPVVLLSFLFAGLNLPVGGGWTTLRWLFLGVGASVGSLIVLRDRRFHFGPFHVIAAFAVLAAMVSAAVSRYPWFAMLKAFSLLLLFVYGATGARSAVAGREIRFFSGLLTGCEIFVAVVMAFRLIGIEAMGNPNSLGAVMGVVAAPILLWGILLGEQTKSFAYQRRFILFALCLYLIFHSHARAGMGAAFVACALLCLLLRKYRSLAQGLSAVAVVVAAVAIVQPETFSNTVSSVTTSVVYKSKDPSLGFMASREAPWQAAIDVIRANFWFGTGFGTTDTGHDASEHLNQFSSIEGVTAENGSSYLAILTWVGVLGALPFLLTLMVLLRRVARTLLWMWRTATPAHPAVPIAMVMIAGLVHAGLEDWLFAPGYYLCVFFWSLAFVLIDLTPAPVAPGVAFTWRPQAVPQGMGAVPSR
ncbi:MAG TPA: O-antigen ligase family protein [Candidatus Nitrosotalea sp.]|nr:O-antigen ligase family protein [Candidatus Nitrosotalea sp.]